jgi:hypothetical protein
MVASGPQGLLTLIDGASGQVMAQPAQNDCTVKLEVADPQAHRN